VSGQGELVTNRDLYKKLEHIGETVTAIAVRIEVLPDLERRMRAMERWRYGLPAGVFLGGLALIQQYAGVHG
jgi:hypothetical protein